MVESPRGSTSRRRVLVADDEPHLRRVLETMLETAGFAVDAVADGAEALHLLADDTRDYVFVLTDLVMPGQTGLDVLRGIRAMNHRSGLPVVVLTAKGQDADREQALALGASDFLTKPFSPRKLLARVLEIVDGED